MRALVLTGFFLLSACGMAPRKASERLADARSVLSSGDAAVRARAAWDLGQLGMAEYPADSPEPPALVSVREVAAAALIPVVSDPEAVVRRAAVEALGKTGGPGIEDVLLSAATDMDAGVRGEIALALFRRRFLKRVPEYSTASLNKLLTLAADPEAEVRWRAVYAFTRFPDVRAEKLLTQAVKDPDKVTRLFAVRALSKLGRSIDASLLSDPDLYVRAEAVAAFGASKAAAELPPAVFSDPSVHVRAAAADAVATTGRAELAGRLEKMADGDGPMARGRALIALAKLRGGLEAARLERARKDPQWWIRSKAFEASAFLPEAGTILSAGVADPDVRVAAQALETLAASTSPLVAPALEKVLRDPSSQLELLGTAIDAAG
ncbi:MAG: hypothetical protein COV48_15855, partial [Elusimicrobia bacterium CG11_big_fil_rev_8_21_14_0_20_64_6]